MISKLYVIIAGVMDTMSKRCKINYIEKLGNKLVFFLVLAIIGGITSCGIATPRLPAKLTPPSLSGTPFEALTKAQTWMADFEKDIGQSIRFAASRILSGEVPDKELKALEARLIHNKQIIVASNGLSALLLQQEQKMTAQNKEVEKMFVGHGVDASLKEQYADTLSTAQKNLESYRICRANVEILGKKVDSSLEAIPQWRQFYASTAGITGNDAAKNKLSEMIVKAAGEWGN